MQSTAETEEIPQSTIEGRAMMLYYNSYVVELIEFLRLNTMNVLPQKGKRGVRELTAMEQYRLLQEIVAIQRYVRLLSYLYEPMDDYMARMERDAHQVSVVGDLYRRLPERIQNSTLLENAAWEKNRQK